MSNTDAQQIPLTDWECTVAPGKTVRLADIVIADWDPIVEAHDKSWAFMASNPLIGSGGMTQAIFDLCCRKAGVETHELTTNEAWSAFNKVADDRPTMYVGGLPDPKADEMETAG